MINIRASLVIGDELWAKKQVGAEEKNAASHGIGSLVVTICNWL